MAYWTLFLLPVDWAGNNCGHRFIGYFRTFLLDRLPLRPFILSDVDIILTYGCIMNDVNLSIISTWIIHTEIYTLRGIRELVTTEFEEKQFFGPINLLSAIFGNYLNCSV